MVVIYERENFKYVYWLWGCLGRRYTCHVMHAGKGEGGVLFHNSSEDRYFAADFNLCVITVTTAYL